MTLPQCRAYADRDRSDGERYFRKTANHFFGAPGGMNRMIGIGDGTAENRQKGVADKLVARAIEFENNLGHLGKIGIKKSKKILRNHPFAQRGESADIAVEKADLDVIASEFQLNFVGRDFFNNLRRKIMPEVCPLRLRDHNFIMQTGVAHTNRRLVGEHGKKFEIVAGERILSRLAVDVDDAQRDPRETREGHTWLSGFQTRECFFEREGPRRSARRHRDTPFGPGKLFGSECG